METIKESNCNILLKMDLLLTDYTLSQGNNHDQEIFINLLDKYVIQLDSPTITTLFIKLTSTNNDQEKDLYIQILTDTLEDLKKVVM